MRFYLTFGVQYAVEPHPTLPRVDPDGYIIVHAPDEITAREMVIQRCGRAWSMLYPEDDWQPSFFPAGPMDEWGKAEVTP